MLTALSLKLVAYGATRTPRDRRWHPRLVPTGRLLGIAGVGIRGLCDCRLGVRNRCRDNRGRPAIVRFTFSRASSGSPLGSLSSSTPIKRERRSCS